MIKNTLLAGDAAVYDIDLLRQLRGRRLPAALQVLCVIGAHRLDELPLINRIFPRLRRIYVFEPLPGPLQSLRALALADPRITVFPVAVSEHDGNADFHVASNDGESSSLLALGSHRELFPEVVVRETVSVVTRRLDSVLAEQKLEPPDAVIIDVQGAELQVLRSFGPALLSQVRLIYSEVSTEPVYAGSGLLADVERLLAPRFVSLGFAPISAAVPSHGNAVFVAQADVGSALAYTLPGRLRVAFHSARRRVRDRQRKGS
jgi:FkbM family methyltransferase